MRIEALPFSHDELFSDELSARIPYHRMYGKQYCLPALALYSEREFEQIRSAALQVDRIYLKALRFAQRHMPDEFLIGRLGLHPVLVPASRIETPLGILSRQDWITGPDGPKCIENNTDTPTGLPEAAFLGNAIVHRHTPLRSASAGMDEALQTALAELLEHYRGLGLTGTVVCTCYDWHEEDRVNTQYIVDAIERIGLQARFVPLERLVIVPGEGLFADEERIELLYRLYPYEYLAHDEDAVTGLPVGAALMELAREGRIGLINPPQCAITQSKGFIAYVWALYERNDESSDVLGHRLFNEADLEAIRAYLLPTYFENTLFLRQKIPYAAKSYWGREGKGTTLHSGDGTAELEQWGQQDNEAEAEEIRRYYSGQPRIYQQLYPMEQVIAPTEQGPFAGSLLTGAYVIGGRFGGLLPRIGEKITGDLAYYCPAAIRQDGQTMFKESN